MNEFEKWWEGTDQGLAFPDNWHDLHGWCKESFKAGMLAAAGIAKTAVKPTGCKEHDWDRQSGALDACAAIKAKREDLK